MAFRVVSQEKSTAIKIHLSAADIQEESQEFSTSEGQPFPQIQSKLKSKNQTKEETKKTTKRISSKLKGRKIEHLVTKFEEVGDEIKVEEEMANSTIKEAAEKGPMVVLKTSGKEKPVPIGQF